MIGQHKPLAKDKPHIVTAWLSLIAFDDVLKFAKFTDIAPENLLQSLMYRLRDFQLNLRNTDPNCTEANLQVRGTQIKQNLQQDNGNNVFRFQVTEQILTHLLDCVDKDKERYVYSLLLLLITLMLSATQCC